MAKGNNNIRSKKPHSSKPYDVSNSFVKKVTSGVSSLLPQSSWFSRWFTSNSNAEDNSSANEGEKPEDLATLSPPCKRARIPVNCPFPANSFRVSSPIDRGETHPWPSESITSPIPNVFSDSPVPGPSGLGRTPVATNAFQSPSPNTESLEGKINGDGGSDSSESTSGCSSLAPQRNTSSGSMTTLKTPMTHKLSNHMLQFSLFPSGMHKLSPTVSTSISKRRPSFNVSSFASPNLDSSKTSRESSLNSPFYIGRTMYGGASAYRRPRDGIPSESLMSSSRRGGVTVRPANEKNQSGSSAEAGMSQTARRILEALEQFSSPVSEARRMPLPSQPPLSAKRKRPLDSTSPVKSSNPPPAAATNPLTIPVPPERLRLHRLQDATEAARRLASSRSDTRGNYTLRTSDETNLYSVTGKVTKYKPLNENERPIPVNLPNIPLPITSLPSFDFSSLTQSTSSSSAPRTKTLSTASKKSVVSEQIGASAEVENIKIPCATSSAPSLSIASDVESTITVSGMKPFNVLHNSSSDVFKTKCDRKSESTSINLGNSTQPNSKTVSFADTVSFNFNKSIDSYSKSDQSNVISLKNNSKANEFVFCTPTVLPTTQSKETSDSKMNNFYFCKPEVLELTHCDKISRKEPNGFHKHSLKSGDGNDSSIKLISINEKSRKNVPSSENESEVKKFNQSGKSIQIENNGWSTKFVLPESWECPECMVRNKNDLDVCVCCGGKRPNASSTTASKDTTGQASDSSSVPKSSWGSNFQLQPGMWECSACLVRNKESDVKCVSCTTPRNSVNIPAPQESCQVGSWGSQFKMSSDLWECSSCLVRNKEQDTKCVSCTTPRSGKTGESNSANKTNKTSDWGQKFKKGSGTWECPVCMIRNKDTLIKCAACEEPKPGLDKNCVATSGSIKFNFEMPSAACGFKFGIDKADSKTAESSTPTSFQFGCEKPEIAKSQSGFSFGTTELKVPTGFTFGIPQPASASSPIAASTTKPSKSDKSSIPNVATSVPSTSTTSATASSKTCVLPETSKVSGFTFGSTAALSSEGPAESKKPSIGKTATSGSESCDKDLQFGSQKASPGSSDDKKTVTTPTAKPGQSGTIENSVNFGTPCVASKPAALSFSASVTSAPATNTSADTTSSSALVAPVTSSIPSATTTSVTRTSSIFSFGSNSSSSFSKPPISSTPTFSLKGSGTTNRYSTLFGATSPSQFKTPNEGLFSNKTAVSTVAPVFGSSSPKSTSVHTFGATPTTTSSAPTFSAPSAAAFAPGSTCTNATFGSSKPIFANSSTSFGSATTSVNSSVSSLVVSSAGTGSNFVTTSASFGVATTTVSLTMTSPTFPTTTTATATPTTSTNFLMPVSTSTVTTSSSTPAFGTSVAFGTPATSSNTFGITCATPSYTTTASNIFGSTNTPSFGASGNPGFGSTTTTPNFASSFGGVTTTSPAFGTTTPAVSTVASTPTLSVFGGFSSSSKPSQGLFLFGSTPSSNAVGLKFSFNNTAQAGATLPTPSGAPGFNFGSANVTNVTTSTTTTPAVAATASAAGAAATPAQGFGGFSFTPGGTAPTQSNSGLFGNATPSVPVFGSNAASTPSAPTFGAGSAASSNVFRPPAFSFSSGGSQQPFTFGSNTQPGSNQASGNTAFSFGQSQPQPPAQPLPQPLQFNPNVRPTFNFTGGETPQFTAAAPSTPTVQRRVKKAVRRSQRP